MESEELLRETRRLIHNEVRAASLASIPRCVQPGEDVASHDPDHAYRWAAMYGDLVVFQRRLVDQLTQTIRTIGCEQLARELDHDRKLVLLRLERARLHLAYWEERTGRPRTQRSVRGAAPDDRILPGEDPESLQPDDVEHWIDVYSELRQFAASINQSELVVRFDRRLRHWQARRERR
jgi:hypothetical protein